MDRGKVQSVVNTSNSMATCSTIAEPNVNSRKDAPGVADVRGIGRIEVRETDQCDASSERLTPAQCRAEQTCGAPKLLPVHSGQRAEHGDHRSDHHGGQHGYGGERQIVRLSAVTDVR